MGSHWVRSDMQDGNWENIHHLRLTPPRKCTSGSGARFTIKRGSVPLRAEKRPASLPEPRPGSAPGWSSRSTRSGAASAAVTGPGVPSGVRSAAVRGTPQLAGRIRPGPRDLNLPRGPGCVQPAHRQSSKSVCCQRASAGQRAPRSSRVACIRRRRAAPTFLAKGRSTLDGWRRALN
jgi:cell wall-associated NlpC family hydrolase